MSNMNSVPSADGGRIHFEVHGEKIASPALVLIHGWSNDRGIWSRHFAGLASANHVAAVDLAGFGESHAGRSDWSMDAFADDVIAVVEALDLERAVLVGFSMGGIVALEAALDIPERLVGVVVVDVLQSPLNPAPDAAARTARAEPARRWRRRIARCTPRGTRAPARAPGSRG